MKSSKNRIKLTFNVDPYSSASHLSTLAPEGYRFVKMERKDNTAIVTFEVKKNDKHL